MCHWFRYMMPDEIIIGKLTENIEIYIGNGWTAKASSGVKYGEK